MRNILFLCTFYTLLFLVIFGCSDNNTIPTSKYEIPTRNHNLSYTPFDIKLDNPNFTICDSTNISSGRNRLKYIGGKNKLRKDITSEYLYKPAYATFNGYVVIRFLVNCEGKSGRYRAQALNLDFSPSNTPSDLLEHSIELIRSLDNWKIPSANDSKKEYSKFINLKISNGKIQHVLL